MFHNAVQSQPVSNPISDNGRVFHIWWGINLLSVLSHSKVIVAAHHCGRGILDDTIEGNAIPMCIGLSDYSDDQFEFAKAVSTMGLGQGITSEADGIFFVDPQAAQYIGVQKSFAGQAQLMKMFTHIVTPVNFRAMRTKVAQFKAGVQADTSGDLLFETIINLKYYQYLRNPKSLGPIIEKT
jgi:hypothetical protein